MLINPGYDFRPEAVDRVEVLKNMRVGLVAEQADAITKDKGSNPLPGPWARVKSRAGSTPVEFNAPTLTRTTGPLAHEAR